MDHKMRVIEGKAGQTLVNLGEAVKSGREFYCPSTDEVFKVIDEDLFVRRNESEDFYEVKFRSVSFLFEPKFRIMREPRTFYATENANSGELNLFRDDQEDKALSRLSSGHFNFIKLVEVFE